ncbi:MAG: DUF1638 domain-containing protein [Chloroflexota bacterium]
MNEPIVQNRPVVILACQIFQHWLEKFLPAQIDTGRDITFFDYGLHAVPKKLRQTIQTTLDNIDQPSLIMLGYGLCGNGLNNINAGKHYLLIPRTDDCIAILLGSYQAYYQQINSDPGTYYLSKGWLESGTNPLQESLALEEKYGTEKATWLMDYQYHNYKRLVMVARNPMELEAYREKALQVAEFCTRWGMRYEELIGKDDYLQTLIEIAFNIKNLTDDFILIPPGEILQQSHFIRGY